MKNKQITHDQFQQIDEAYTSILEVKEIIDELLALTEGIKHLSDKLKKEENNDAK